jgi:hypothetical protein
VEAGRRGVQIFKLIYRSRSRLSTTRGQFAAELENILSRSRAKNTRVGVTGALFVGPSRFAQYLEGPVDAVKNLIGHIMCDPRHHHLELLYTDVHEQRTFGEWAMMAVMLQGDQITELTDKKDTQSEWTEEMEEIHSMLRWLVTDDVVTHGGHFH